MDRLVTILFVKPVTASAQVCSGVAHVVLLTIAQPVPVGLATTRNLALSVSLSMAIITGVLKVIVGADLVVQAVAPYPSKGGIRSKALGPVDIQPFTRHPQAGPRVPGCTRLFPLSESAFLLKYSRVLVSKKHFLQRKSASRSLKR